MSNEARRERWEQAARWPLVSAALLFLGAYAWPILDPGLSQGWFGLCRLVIGAVWLVFVLDYVVRFALSDNRWLFVRGSVFDLITILLPMLRPLRLLWLVGCFEVLDRRAGSALRGRVAFYVIATVSLVVLVSSLSVLSLERGQPGANIENFGDSVWWAMTTVATVGYGDVYPVTATGRLVAVGLMTFGVALLGVVTASMASRFRDHVRSFAARTPDMGADTATVLTELSALREQVTQLRAELALPHNDRGAAT